MTSEVILTAKTGRLKGREFSFRAPTHCLAGRSPDCFVYIPDAWATVSRYHCQFDIDPPRVQVRDLGSLNGTWINGENIGRRDRDESPEDAAGMPRMARTLRDGDLVRVGSSVFEVQVETVPDETDPPESAWAEEPAQALAC